MRFLAIYMGGATPAEIAAITPEQNRAFMTDWFKWAETYASQIVEQGAPLGKTKSVNQSGAHDVKNAMTGYTVVEADSHEEAARMFEGHPHIELFVGNWIEVMACLPIPASQ